MASVCSCPWQSWQGSADRLSSLDACAIFHNFLTVFFMIRISELIEVRKSHCHVFLGGLDPGQAYLETLFFDAKTNLSIFITLLKLLVHFPKVTMVIALAPHEVHPYHSTERRYLPSWRIYRSKIGISCFRPWRLSLVVSHPKTPILNCLYHLLWFYFLTLSEFSCFAKS